MKTLIYSFEKFHNLQTNPAFEVAKEIKKEINNINLIQLPVTYDCWKILKKEIEKTNPDFILGIGVAIGSDKVRIEKIALNYKHATIPDNNGVKFQLEKIFSTGELALETDIDVRKISEKLNQEQIPTEISLHSRYVCNYTYYNCLNHTKNTKQKTLFIHVPLSPKQAISLNADIASFPTEIIAKEISQILKNLK